MLLLTSADAVVRPAYLRAENETDAGIPLIQNPDFSICWSFTNYIFHVVLSEQRALSTARAYANHLAVFLRFLTSQHPGLSVWEVCDRHLFEFVAYLEAEPDGPSAEQINKILRRVINAYIFFKSRNPAKHGNLIRKSYEDDGEPDSAQIRYTIRTRFVRDKSGKGRDVSWIHHDAILTKKTKPKRRKPIPDTFIDRLWEAIPRLSNSSFIRDRMECALTVLEQVAPRVDELARISVDALKAAEHTRALEYVVTKTGIGAHAVPFPEDLWLIVTMYAHGPRQQAIDRGLRLGTIKEDHGFLFVTDTGEPWARSSMITAFLNLRKLAGIAGAAHAHLFRHRWITKNAIALAKNMVGTPLERSVLTIWLKELSGHLSDAGVVTYVDEAFEGREAFDVAKPVVSNDLRARLLNYYTKRLEAGADSAGVADLSQKILSILEELPAPAEHQPPAGAPIR